MERALRDLGASLAAGPEHARLALRDLFRDDRLRVGPDPEHGFRIEGTAWISVGLKERSARTLRDSGASPGG
jgi:hypothetical protein